MLAPRMDRVERLDYAERWIGDGFRVLDTPGGFAAVDVDMTRTGALVERLRTRGVRATHNHVIVRAAALALSRHPELHQLVAGNRRLRPERVDIGLSVAGHTNYAPIMIIEDAARKALPALCDEIVRRVPEVRQKEVRDLAGMRRWGRLIPFAGLRRLLLRFLFGRVGFRRRLAGTFQVSCIGGVDLVVPFLFNTSAVLGVGRVRDRVVAAGGQPAVRPMVTLACCIDHKAWDGVKTARFQTEVRRILEEGQLDGEAE